jgi:hypothetical protein
MSEATCKKCGFTGLLNYHDESNCQQVMKQRRAKIAKANDPDTPVALPQVAAQPQLAVSSPGLTELVKAIDRQTKMLEKIDKTLGHIRCAIEDLYGGVTKSRGGY